jgi:hypothetical protein
MKGKIFNAPEVQSMIAGNKRQFREVKVQPNSDRNPVKMGFNFTGIWGGGAKENRRECPYQVGQKIFCKESFWEAGGKIIYRADYESYKPISPWRRAMKQEQSRLTLLIKEIRVERLQSISEEDAIAEGMFFTDYGKECYHAGYDINTCPSIVGHENQKHGWNWKENKSHSECLASAYWAFANKWNATHKKPEEKFGANPGVWVVNFEVINN